MHDLMKRKNLYLSIAALLMASAFSAQAANLLEAAETSGNLKSFVAAAKKTGMNDLLTGTGPYTVFVPTDEAISKFGTARWQALEKDKDLMLATLSRHIIPGKVLITEIKPGSEKTINGSTIRLKSDNGKVTVESANVTQSDITADNGVIHAIDTVLEPPK